MCECVCVSVSVYTCTCCVLLERVRDCLISHVMSGADVPHSSEVAVAGEYHSVLPLDGLHHKRTHVRI